MKSSETKAKYYSHELGELNTLITTDGSITLHSSKFKESFHNTLGAKSEAQEKYLNPSDLSRFNDKSHLNILDVCIGLGYNTACILEYLIKASVSLDWFGLELDKRPIKIALGNKNFREYWSPKVLEILQSIDSTGEWDMHSSKGKILWGDAREKFKELPTSMSFDLILLDPFSPNQCPELWSEEFLSALSEKLAPNGRILTYCRAAAIRATLRRANLEIQSLKVASRSQKKWSEGTIAIRSANPSKEDSKVNYRSLNQMEEEHLYTRAAVPYRDFTGKDSKTKILNRRKNEQLISKLEITNSWRKRWNQAISN